MNTCEKLCEAFKAIIDDLNENINDQDIEAIEEENKYLYQKKMELISNLNRPSTANASIILVKEITLRQKNVNNFRYETKQNSVARYKDRSNDIYTETTVLKRELKNNDTFMIECYHDVLKKINEFKDKIAENCSVIDELTDQHSQLTQNEQVDFDEAEDIRHIENLKNFAEEQRQLIEQLKGAEV